MHPNYRPLRAEADESDALRHLVLRTLLIFLHRSFVDAGKEEYEAVDIAKARSTPLSAPNCTFEYATINLHRWILEALVELRIQERPETIFGDLELAQFILAFEGPEGSCNAREIIRSYFETETDYVDYLNSLSFIYNTHDNPFKRLEVIIIHLLMTDTIPCYTDSNPASIRFSQPTYGAT